MDNLQIADAFSFLSKLMEIHGENSFKAKSFAVAAYTIEKLPINLTALPDEKIFNIPLAKLSLKSNKTDVLIPSKNI